jgi:hypothetical protein
MQRRELVIELERDMSMALGLKKRGEVYMLPKRGKRHFDVSRHGRTRQSQLPAASNATGFLHSFRLSMSTHFTLLFAVAANISTLSLLWPSIDSRHYVVRSLIES